MARRKKKKNGRRSTIRIGAAIGLAAGSYLFIKRMMEPGSPRDRSRKAVMCLTGYNIDDGTFKAERMVFTIPVVAGVGLSMVASKVGLNRYTPKGINI